MQYRSWMVVPAEQEKKLGLASNVGADVVVLDLASAPTREAKQAARLQVADWLAAHRGPQFQGERWVQLNSLESRMWRDDLIAVMAAAPEGVILPKTTSPDSVREIAAEIYEIEPRHGLAPGSTKIIPIVGECARSAMQIAHYIDASLPRLAGLAWGVSNLKKAIGASRHRNKSGALTDAYGYVRAQTLLTAHACGVLSIDQMCDAAPSDEKAAFAAAQIARSDGFSGMFASHPAQVKAINAAFQPSDAELENARAILAAAKIATPDGEVLDRRVLRSAELQQAKRMVEAMDAATPQPDKVKVTIPLRPA